MIQKNKTLNMVGHFIDTAVGPIKLDRAAMYKDKCNLPYSKIIIIKKKDVVD